MILNKSFTSVWHLVASSLKTDSLLVLVSRLQREQNYVVQVEL